VAVYDIFLLVWNIKACKAMPRVYPSSRFIFASAIIILAAGHAGAQPYQYTAIDYGSGYSTTIENLDSHDDVVGFAQNSSPNIIQIGFVWHNGIFTTIPQTLFNDVTASGVAIGNDATSGGFYLYDIKSGGLTDHPDKQYTLFPLMIGNKNFVVGSNIARGRQQPRTIIVKHDQALPLEINDKPVTFALDVNASSEVVGFYGMHGHGFLLNHGVVTTFDAPDALYTRPDFISDSGIVAGGFRDQKLDNHGFVLNNGAYVILDPPGEVNPIDTSKATNVVGIGKDGESAGYYSDAAGNLHGFIYRSGTYYQIDYPGASSTRLDHISSKGSFIGDAVVGGKYIEFIAQCPKQRMCSK
jgi:hypothetical protein